jgi:hypothetical protein
MILHGNLLPYLRLKSLSAAVPIKRHVRWILHSSLLQRQPVNLQRVTIAVATTHAPLSCTLARAPRDCGCRRKEKKKGREKIKNEGK